MNRLRLAVLISGAGSNLQALIDARDAGRLPVEIAEVVSNRGDAGGLARAHRAGIATTVLDPARFDDRTGYDGALADHLARGAPDLIVLAGFMRLLGSPVLSRLQGRILNLHPSLLPRHRGLDTCARALAAGDREHGASMHFVSAELDGGPVLAQVRIPLEPADDPRRLAARLAPREHALVVATVGLFTRHRVRCDGERITLDGTPLRAPLRLGADDRLPV